MKAWITVEVVTREGEEDHPDIYYYIWSTEPEWDEESRIWSGKQGTAIDICGDVLSPWLGHLPKRRECLELNITEGTTWLPV